ncbi:hypothetical protein CFC21_102941 [Triticum aestivum]|uniref:Uncharacterized protein n=2 Tax=Triticum aestivum TaxID=4565 RepID=A0A3B6SJK8_WHEAT|nr:uncharacterized protein LOC123161695 isoform X1 [Triticum aestivum]KAF7101679.1 hypothetical protein CFC21_102941 [Triticum aestivum]
MRRDLGSEALVRRHRARAQLWVAVAALTGTIWLLSSSSVVLFGTHRVQDFVVDELWRTADSNRWRASFAPHTYWPPPPTESESNGYLRVRCNGGLSQQRSAICNAGALSMDSGISSKRSGQIRSRPMVEKTEYRDEPLEHGLMGCSRARCRSSLEGKRAGRRGGEEGGMQGACRPSSRRPSLRCSSGWFIPALGLRVQCCPHHPLLPLAHRPVRVQRSNTPHCLLSIFRYIYLYKVYRHPMYHMLLIDQVIEVEVNGVRQRSGVLIKKRSSCLDSLLPPPQSLSPRHPVASKEQLLLLGLVLV